MIQKLDVQKNFDGHRELSPGDKVPRIENCPGTKIAPERNVYDTGMRASLLLPPCKSKFAMHFPFAAHMLMQIL